jgi:hypothetical protein
MANAGKDPVRVQTPAQPSSAIDGYFDQAEPAASSLEPQPLPPVSFPPGWACPGTGDIENIHVRLSPAPDYFAQGKAMGMTDDQARAYVAQMVAAEKDLHDQMLRTIATLQPPPCPTTTTTTP